MLFYSGEREKPTILYAVRHGETNWNREHRLQGLSDIPINQNGYKQAKQVAEKLKKCHFELIYSSDLLRAFETASIISQVTGCKKIVRSELLRERFFGPWEGKDWEEIHQVLPACHTIDQLPGVEPLKEIQRRAFAMLQQIDDLHQGKSVVLVTHGAWLEALLIAIDPPSASSILIENAACMVFLHGKKGWQWNGFLQ